MMMKQRTSVTKALPEDQFGMLQVMGAQVLSMLSVRAFDTVR